jgi:hypothetical protein
VKARRLSELALFLAGVAFFVHGLFMWSRPLAFIAGGMIAMIVAIGSRMTLAK